ncbi:MAG TPA: hypothetical protein VIN60_08145 [Anaerolineales bacterium]
MNARFQRLMVIGLATILVSTACIPKATPSAADQLATNIAIGVPIALTRTAEAPTPKPSATPTQTAIPATVTPTSKPIQPPTVINFAPCWFGPGPGYNLESNIEQGAQVQLVGVGSLPGWYIIINPYFYQRCWIQAANLSIDPRMDLSQIPLMTPIPLRTPKP